MKWMGHADQTMILKVYAHLTERKEEEAALKMRSFIDGWADIAKIFH